jgi:hypothetical protein
VSVDVPVTDRAAYRFVADEYAANHPRWDNGILSVDLDGPVRSGASGSEVRRFLGARSTAVRTTMTRLEQLLTDTS